MEMYRVKVRLMYVIHTPGWSISFTENFFQTSTVLTESISLIFALCFYLLYWRFENTIKVEW